MTGRHILILGAFLGAVACYAAAPQAATSGPLVSFTATSANVSGAPDAIRIDILRWSTDAERDKLMDAWSLKNTSGGRGGRGGTGRGAGRGGPARGGRGATDGEAAANPPAGPTPEAMLANALKEAATVGYLWSREVAGYAIRYAGKIAAPDGSERIVLITQRRLGAVNDLWKPTGAEPPAYDFSVIELHVNAHGKGEGKTSLNGKVTADSSSSMIVLENYDALPVVFSNVQRRAGVGDSK
jgi:hypothetical protein